ncbi:MAG TPA: hypothetical protein VGC28_08645 [Sphingomonas sp.]
MTTTGQIGKRRGIWLAGLALLVSGCAAPIRPFGTLAIPADSERGRTFAMVAGKTTDADAAVREALLAAEYRVATDARYRVEVGFAVRGPRIGVMAAGGGQDMRPLAPISQRPGLCRRQSYVLSIAFVDQASGRVAARGGAITSRCGRAPVADLLPRLARAALANAGKATS